MRALITRVNRIRRENAALHQNRTLRFHRSDNEQLLAYSKRSADGRNVILTVVNLDPHHRRAGWLDLDLDALGVAPDESFQVHDLLGESRFLWHGSRNFVELDPAVAPGHVLRVRHRVRTEADFEYYL
jgi:starch synthase (maltosyl-transferring)